MNRPTLLLVAFIVPILGVFGCSTGTPVKAPSIEVDPLPQLERVPYRLQAGDRLAISFWGNPELDREILVRPDGFISLPFVDDVRAEGLAPADLDAELTRRYTGELTSPEITVMVLEVSQRVYVGGEVEEEGSVPLPGRLTLMQAISEAGGFRFTARRKQVLLIRSMRGGEVVARSIDMRPALMGSDVAGAANLPLQANDIIFVPRARIENVRLFVEQYIYGLLPVGAATTIRILEN